MFITSIVKDRTRRHEVLLLINHKKYNFREKKNRQVIKERENLKKKTLTGDVSILRQPHLLLVIIRRQKHQSNYSYECDWLIDLSDNKLSNNQVYDNNLARQVN